MSSSQIPQISEIVVIVPIRSDTIRVSTVPRTILSPSITVPNIVRSPTEMYDIVPNVFNTVQYGTPCNTNCVPVTVPFSIVQGLKTSKRNNTHLRRLYETSTIKKILVPH